MTLMSWDLVKNYSNPTAAAIYHDNQLFLVLKTAAGLTAQPLTDVSPRGEGGVPLACSLLVL